MRQHRWALWCLVALALVLGFEVKIRPLQAQITRTQQRARQLYDAANANDAIARASHPLQAAKRRIRLDIERAGGQSNASAQLAETLRLFGRESARFHVAIRALSADPAPSSGTARSVSPPTPAADLVEQRLSLSLRGTFRNILALLADLPHHNVLLEVRDAQLNVGQRAESGVVLDASVASAIYRIKSPSPLEEKHAAKSLRR